MTVAIERSQTWASAFELVRERGYQRREQPFKLASGQLSQDYIDGKYAIDRGDRLRTVSNAMAELAASRQIEYDAVGGLTMGADPLAHGIALVTGVMWFSVRKEPKPRGREQWVEGARLTSGNRVLLVDDVVTSGGSILQAYDHVREVGATVTGVMPMVDRGDAAEALFKFRGVPYAPLITYRDLGIDPTPLPPMIYRAALQRSKAKAVTPDMVTTSSSKG
jgi:orotate phosphoribosyltransferase